jgi:ribosome-binding protein aMBF1 (putative translation factor)
MITAAQRVALRACGFSDDRIRAMRPADAHAALAADPEPVRQPVEQPRSGAVDSLRAARMACGSQPSAPPRPSEGERIRSAREARGWSQKRLATEAETHQPCVSSLERDRPVNAPTRTRVLDALGLIAEQLDQGD